MTKILILGTAILAVDPVDAGASWQTPGQIIPKAGAVGAQVVEVDLPAGFSPHNHEWNGAAVVPAGVTATAVPKSVTKRQGRQMLLLAGKLDQVPLLIAAIEDDLERGLAQIYWDDSQEYERYHPLVITIGGALGLDLDQMFIDGAKL
jgi:hypothetical protein